MVLSNRVAVITGGGTGIGKEVASLFAREGAIVIVVGRREPPLRATVEEITSKGGVAELMLTDVGDYAQVGRVFEQTAAKHGGIDILVNSAGVFFFGKKSHEFTIPEWEDAFRVNFWGTLYCCRQAIPFMRKRGKGSIVNCTSVAGRIAFKNQTPYNTAKAAVEMLSKCLAKELGEYNIRVNTVCPDLTDTPMAVGHLERHGLETIKSWFPLNRMGQPIDIAEAILFMASDRSSWITGHSLFVDGGKHTY